MFRRYAIWLLLVLTVSQLALECSIVPGGPGNNTKPVSIVIWGPFDETAALNPVFAAFKQKNSNVSITFVKKDIATYETDLINALAANAGPDIFAIHNDWLPRYQDKMTPAPDKLFTAREITENYVDVVKDDLVSLDGGLYALPFYMDVLALYYNKDLLGSVGIALPPQSWTDVIAAVKKLTRQDRFGNFLTNGIAMGTSTNINRSTDVLSLLMLQNGTQVFNSTRDNATMDREIVSGSGTRYNPGAQALDFYTQFANPAKETYTWNSRNNYSIDAFVSGQAAMMLSYSYQAANLRQKAPLLNFGISPAPQIDLAKPKVNYSNYFAFGVSKLSPNSKLAWDLIKFATTKESSEMYTASNKRVSPRKDVISAQIADPDLGVFAEGSLTAKTFYKPDSSRVEKVLAQMIDDVILRNVTPQQAVSQGNRQLNNLLRN